MEKEESLREHINNVYNDQEFWREPTTSLLFSALTLGGAVVTYLEFKSGIKFTPESLGKMAMGTSSVAAGGLNMAYAVKARLGLGRFSEQQAVPAERAE